MGRTPSRCGRPITMLGWFVGLALDVIRDAFAIGGLIDSEAARFDVAEDDMGKLVEEGEHEAVEAVASHCGPNNRSSLGSNSAMITLRST